MDRDVLSLISKDIKRFSKGQRLISEYILDNYDKAAFMTAGKLGKTVGVSESTVVRFAAKLGYDGYPGMRRALQDMIRNRLTSVQRIEVSRDLINDKNILDDVLHADMSRMQLTFELTDKEVFDRAVETIWESKHIYIAGTRSASALASFMAFYLNLIMENVHLVNDTAPNEVFDRIFRIGEQDLFIGISYPRYSSRTLNAMKFAKSAGAKVMGITDGESSPFIGIADINLFAKSGMVSFLDSLVAPLSLINALIVSVGMRSNTTLSETFQRLEGIWSEYEVYENSGE